MMKKQSRETVSHSVRPLMGILAFIALFIQSVAYGNDDFPIRALYPKAPVIELEDLHSKRDAVVIIDVRSSYEYDTLHIKSAINLSLSDKNFINNLEDLRAKDKRPFVFYCNGHTCRKSYKATHKAQQAGFDNVFVFDAGIFDWTKAYPEDAVLLGKTPVDPAWLLSKEKFHAHLLPPEQFADHVGNDSILIDIRDSLQRGLALFPMQQHSVPLDNTKLKVYVERAKNENKTLLIYDAVGKQVKWLQYYLESENLSNYYFLKEGADGFYKYLGEKK